ncbi:ERF family protein, partial [Camelimonas fluminis]
MINVVQIERQNELPPAPMVPLTPMAMISQAIAQGADLSMVQQLMDLQDRHDAKLARKEFDAALAAAKSEIPVIRKNRSVSYGQGKAAYAHEDLGEVARTVDPVLAQHGLSYRFRPEQRDGRVRVTCILSHVDGHNEESTLEAGADTSGSKNSIQAIGSTVTYLQRYTLKMALGLAAAEDDDG